MTTITPYDVIGGEQAILNLVDRFYFYMDTLPEAQGIRAMIGSEEAAASVCPQNRAYGSVHGSSRNTYSMLKPIYSFSHTNLIYPFNLPGFFL